jgi:PIN domain nuclease of toxin-antitoxin system
MPHETVEPWCHPASCLAAMQRIDAAPVVYISAISGFEIGIKVQKGKLQLPARPADWFTAVLAHHNLEVLPLDLLITVLGILALLVVMFRQ